eukprot:CAMPEP_0201506600 /NCGR_PEP_ID=MMETSP0161_2-20130828/504_1 /ASSEMBLY_ACC=CAM_ASM_000251 /TAXON_ID=180227 /ORGANISM="Neoparamoeba aestuarina, Strain SoJaBio B1-5/56/2" /LENGTH=663 /DNA_ID=CAMNT_0047900741 /DNA_START=270 /DNA_END=2261 /DNA_ORIENTATION=-
MKGKLPDYNDACNCSLAHSTIDKFKLKKNELVFECKDFRVCKFLFPGETGEQAYKGIERFANAKQTNRFCYFNTELAEPLAQGKITKWFYSAEKEFKRFTAKWSEAPTFWRMTNMNSNYSVCSTYPKEFGVPISLQDKDLLKVADHRSRGRLPILSYVHENGAVIVRCAQPKAGLKGGKNKADVTFAQALVACNKFSKGLSIMDARPKLNAAANRAAGAGYENTAHYENATLKFLDIENIHVMRDAVNSLKDLCLSTAQDDKFLTNVDNTMCLTHVKIILDGAWQIAQKILSGETVLVHCSDGWDRTAQLCSLSALLLDPFYRTIEGFITLVEREWIQAGHKFNDRIGQDNTASRSERSPVFLQFVDCVWQITQQFPTAFEFSENLLLDMLEALYSCRFGTFLFNCEKEREDNDLRGRSPSFWDYIFYHKYQYLNQCYDPPAAVGSKLVTGTPPILSISYAMKDIRIWTNYYMQYVSPGRVTTTVMLQNEIMRLRGILKELGHEDKSVSNNEALQNSTPIEGGGGGGKWAAAPKRGGLSQSTSSVSPSYPPRDGAAAASSSQQPPLASSRSFLSASVGGDRGEGIGLGRNNSANSNAQLAGERGGAEKAKVLYQWVARDTNEVSVEAEEVVTVVSKSSENWWFVERDGGMGSGHVPSTYVSLI